LLIVPVVESVNRLSSLATTIQDTLSKLYSEHKSAVYLTASVGIASYPESGKTTDLFDNVHKALIEAKKLGAGSTFLYRESKNKHAFDEARLQHEIQFSVEREELMIFYQPIVDARTHKVVGAEALMRWRHSEYGLIPPFVFVPIMEKTGFIIEAGRFLIHEVIRQQARWKQFGFEEIFISLNASMREIDTPDYIQYLVEQLNKYRVDPTAIKVEITESLAMSNVEKMLRTLSRLHATGIPISLDDFGTGYTSFSYLTQMPAETLKIDKSFIDHLLEEPKNQQVVRAIIEVGHALGMKVVAEGIENKQMAEKLLEFGVDLLQGYYFSKPVPVYEFQGALVKRTHAQGAPDAAYDPNSTSGLSLIDP
jgi:polar amino acid transport system substrate-binding protein